MQAPQLLKLFTANSTLQLINKEHSSNSCCLKLGVSPPDRTAVIVNILRCCCAAGCAAPAATSPAKDWCGLCRPVPSKTCANTASAREL
jgi:hypothetical protein